MADQNGSSSDNSQSIPLGDNSSNDNTADADTNGAGTPVDNGAGAVTTPNTATNTPAQVSNAPAPAAQSNDNAVVSPSQAPVDTTPPPATSPAPVNSVEGQLPTGGAGVSQAPSDPNALVMNFSADCWLEVTDANGKKLFSGLQRSGGKLSLAGQPPYRLKIGAPAAVQVQYQNQPVDLSRFIRNNQVARLTVGAQ